MGPVVVVVIVVVVVVTAGERRVHRRRQSFAQLLLLVRGFLVARQKSTCHTLVRVLFLPSSDGFPRPPALGHFKAFICAVLATSTERPEAHRQLPAPANRTHPPFALPLCLAFLFS
jgi:hypothetical protein